MTNLSLVDLVVLVAYLLGIVWLGVWLGRGSRDSKSYLLGGRDAPWWAILGSIVATETSTVTFLSVPSLAFAEGGNLRFLQLAFGYISGRIMIAWWLLPFYFKGNVVSAYELLQDRFGGNTRKLASAIFLVTRNLGDGLRLFLTALVLEATLEWSLPMCVVVIGIATIVFTFFGGMKSVIWNDCIQLVVYMLGGILILLLIVGRLESGWEGLAQFAQQTGRASIFDFGFWDNGPRFEDTFTFWAGLIGGAFLTLGTHGTDQMLVQRLLASRSQGDAGKALIASGFVVLVQFALFLIVGIALASFYFENPNKNPGLTGDRVLSNFIVHEMPVGVGLIGVLLAAVFSAAMSTLSSSLNSSATSVVSDWIMPGKVSEGNRVVGLTKIFTIVFGVVQMVIAIWAAGFDESVVQNALAIAGFSSGLLLGLFAIGLFLPKANQIAATVGLASGLILLVAIKFGFGSLPEESPWSYRVAWPWFPVVGSLSTFAVGWLCDRLTRRG